MKEFFTDVLHMPISESSIASVLQPFVKKALPCHSAIKQRIEAASYVGTDETSMAVNDGEKHWVWTWQNSLFTFIVCTDNRALKQLNNIFLRD